MEKDETCFVIKVVPCDKTKPRNNLLSLADSKSSNRSTLWRNLGTGQDGPELIELDFKEAWIAEIIVLLSLSKKELGQLEKSWRSAGNCARALWCWLFKCDALLQSVWDCIAMYFLCFFDANVSLCSPFSFF